MANSGDSRAVLCRDGTAIDLSLDHKPEDDIERTRIVNAGGFVNEDGRYGFDDAVSCSSFTSFVFKGKWWIEFVTSVW